jgi:hypothetical protein
LAHVRTEVFRLLPDPWEGSWLSEARAEIQNTQAGPAGPWGENPVRTAYAMAFAFLGAATNCAGTLSDTINVQTTAPVANLLSRACMESGARMWWLMQPGIGARRRVIRAVLLRAKGARDLSQAVRKLDPKLDVAEFGETPAAVRDYAARLGISYVCNDERVESEDQCLPGPTASGVALERAMRIPGAYKIYSGAAHSSWFAIAQSWRKSASGLWEPRPDREAVWSCVIASAGFVMEPAGRALNVLGRGARAHELGHLARNIDDLIWRMRLPPEWSNWRP